jgi:hypothetical protein
MSVALALALAQAAGWVVVPATPAVGDTVWVEQVVEVPPGWVVRPSSWTPEGESVEALGPALTLAVAGGTVVVRYPLVIWEPGTLEVTPPPVWRIGPAGEADSVASRPITIAVRSVLPDDSVTPRPPRAPLERDARTLLPVFVSLTAGGGLALGWWWLRRRPAAQPADNALDAAPVVPLGSTGDAAIDAARLAARLRGAIAQSVPAAHRALTTEQCLAVVAVERPEWPLDDLRAALRRLDTARFAPDEIPELPALAEEVEALEQVL